MAHYSVGTTALALGIDRKRLENMLLRCVIPGTVCGRQGRSRRLARESIRALAVVLLLQERLGLPVVAAAALLPELLGGDSGGTAARGPVQLRLDLAAIEREITAGIAGAVEIAPRPRRGRPSRNRRPR